MDGVSYKTIEVYKHNAFGPSFSYAMLFICDEDGKGCQEVQRTPNVTPGFIASLIEPVIQAGAILGGAALISDGLRQSGDHVSLNNSSSSMSRAAAKSASSSRAGGSVINGGGRP
jgi:hypothetical protein